MHLDDLRQSSKSANMPIRLSSLYTALHKRFWNSLWQWVSPYSITIPSDLKMFHKSISLHYNSAKQDRKRLRSTEQWQKVRERNMHLAYCMFYSTYSQLLWFLQNALVKNLFVSSTYQNWIYLQTDLIMHNFT